MRTLPAGRVQPKALVANVAFGPAPPNVDFLSVGVQSPIGPSGSHTIDAPILAECGSTAGLNPERAPWRFGVVAMRYAPAPRLANAACKRALNEAPAAAMALASRNFPS